MELLKHLRKLRKAQLQEYYLRWFPGQAMISDRDKLVERLQEVMADPREVRAHFDRLSKSQQDFIVALLTQQDFRGTLAQIRSVPRARSIENYEVENLVRNLGDEGWIVPVTESSNGMRSEVYLLTREVGEGLRTTVDLECREAQVLLSLEAFLRNTKRASSAAEVLARLTREGELEKTIEGLPDPELRRAVHAALEQHGGILPLCEWRKIAPESARRLEPSGNGVGAPSYPTWRQQLEEAFLGTTGVLSLKNYGIDLEEECVILFQELVQAYALQQVASAAVENDKEFSLGVDLLIDIRRLLEMARTEAVEVTRDGTVFKKTEERISERLLTTQQSPLFDGSPVDHLLLLCKRLRLLSLDDHHLRADRVRRRLWAKKSIPAMLRTIFELYQNESRGSHWSFHQSILRELFLSRLTAPFASETGANAATGQEDNGEAPETARSLPLGQWRSMKPVLTSVVAEFLASLESHHVAETLKELEMEDFHRGTLMVSLERLSQDLTYWVIHRLAIVGLVDLGFQDGTIHSIRVSSLGARYFKLQTEDTGNGQLVVNPDFEILLFPGGKEEAETNYVVGSFADRTGTEWVKRYRVTRKSVKRGVISGQSSDDILGFLEQRCRTPIPPNVKYSIREWAEGVEPILKQRVMLLRARSESGADQLSRILTENEVTHERIGETAVVIRGVRQEKAILALQDTLRAAGLFLE